MHNVVNNMTMNVITFSEIEYDDKSLPDGSIVEHLCLLAEGVLNVLLGIKSDWGIELFVDESRSGRHVGFLCLCRLACFSETIIKKKMIKNISPMMISYNSIGSRFMNMSCICCRDVGMHFCLVYKLKFD